VDLATRFGHLATPLIETYPVALRERIEELDGWLGPAVNHGVAADGRPGPAREALLDAFEQLDGRLARSRYLLGDRLTEADIRLWVTLVRYDAGPNAYRSVSPGLHVHPHLWSYARDLWRIPAFRDTTDFTSFTRPGAVLPDWDAPADR
jgi:putative glutathione S-transferase